MTDLKEQTFFDVVEKVAVVTEEKLATAVKFYSKKKVIPKNTIAGIDLTRGGENLTAEEHEIHQKKVMKLHTEREALKLAVTHWKALVLPKVLFEKIRKPLGLFIIYPSSSLYWVKDNSWGDAISDAKDKVEIDKLCLEDIKSWKRENIIGRLIAEIGWTVIPCALLWGVIGVAYGLDKIAFESISLIGCLGTVVFIAMRIYCHNFIVRLYERSLKRSVDKLAAAKDLKKAFPDLTLKNLYNHSASFLEIGRRTFVDVKLPTPPKEVVDIISDVVNRVPKSKGFEIVTIADEAAIGLDIKLRSTPKPVAIPTNDTDPGVFVEYGEFVAVLPDTFYHVTPLERQFIRKVYEVAEQWDARSYIFN